MSLLRNYNNFGAKKLYNFTASVIIGLANSLFSSLATLLTELTILNTALDERILPFNQSTKSTNDLMLAAKDKVIKVLDEIRPLADEICAGDYANEQLSGFTPSKRGRTRITSIAAARVDSVEATTVPGQLLISLHEAVPKNQGFEVHYTVGTEDRIVGVYKVKGRTLQFVASGFPSGVLVQVHLITLATNNVSSDPSNPVTARAL